MLLKICYKPNGFYYVKDIASIDFDNCTNTDWLYDKDTNLCYSVAEDGSISLIENAIGLTSSEYLEKEFGACKHDTSDNLYYVNSISFTLSTDESNDGNYVLFTGIAYLCDDSGKTIDVLK